MEAGGVWKNAPRGEAIRLGTFESGPGWEPGDDDKPDETFWKQVVNLDYAFQGGNWIRIAPFYARYGGFLEPEARLRGPGDSEIEPWSTCQDILSWLRRLTRLLAQIKGGRTAELQRWFNPGGDAPRSFPVVLSQPRGHLDGHRLVFRGFRRRESGARGDVCEYSAPETDRDLLSAAWSTVDEAIAEEMARIPLHPVAYGRPLDSDVPIVWQFQCEGALRAAFLDWYFEEVVGFGPARCSATDCTNLVPPGRRKYCCRRCADRDRQRRHRG